MSYSLLDTTRITKHAQTVWDKQFAGHDLLTTYAASTLPHASIDLEQEHSYSDLHYRINTSLNVVFVLRKDVLGQKDVLVTLFSKSMGLNRRQKRVLIAWLEDELQDYGPKLQAVCG